MAATEALKDRITIHLSDDDKRHIAVIRARLAENYLAGQFMPKISLSDVVRYALASAAVAPQESAER